MDVMLMTVQKAPTPLTGLDEVLVGRLPIGRVTLVCGGPGAGKTMPATQFLVSGAPKLDEPGLFVSFEEIPAGLVANSASLGWDIVELIGDGRLRVEEIRAAQSQLTEAAPYDLEAPFTRLGHAIDAAGACRVVLDTLETSFGAMRRRGNLGARAARGPSVRSRRGARGQVDVVRKSTAVGYASGSDAR